MSELSVSEEKPLQLPGLNFVRGAAEMPIAKQAVLVIAVAASVAAAVAVVLWMKDPDYKALPQDLSPGQVADVVSVLDEHQISYRIDQQSNLLLIQADQYYQAKMHLAGADVGSDRQRGFEMLDEDQAFGVSQFMEQARFRQSLEGELARSIATIESIRDARVHIAIPKSSSFLRDTRTPTASVKVALRAGARLVDDQIRGIANLIARAVPNMSPADVSVVDQTGRLLQVDADDATDATERQLTMTARTEANLRKKIENILTPAVGAGRFNAEVAAVLDFTALEQTAEVYNPDQRVRSEVVIDEERFGSDVPAGVPGALTNQPPVNAAAPEVLNDGENAQAQPDKPSKARSEATRNYELDRTISHTRHQVGSLQKLSVSVVLDDFVTVNPEDGSITQEPWTEEALQQIESLIQTAVGFDAARGDTLSVVNSPFLTGATQDFAESPFWAEAWFLDLVKKVMGGLVLLLIVLGLIRPLVRSVSQRPQSQLSDAALAQLEDGSGAAPGSQQALADASGNSSGARAGGGAEGAEGAEGTDGAGEESADVPGLPALTALDQSRIVAVRELVSDHPERVAEVVKQWVAEDE